MSRLARHGYTHTDGRNEQIIPSSDLMDVAATPGSETRYTPLECILHLSLNHTRGRDTILPFHADVVDHVTAELDSWKTGSVSPLYHIVYDLRTN